MNTSGPYRIDLTTNIGEVCFGYEVTGGTATFILDYDGVVYKWENVTGNVSASSRTLCFTKTTSAQYGFLTVTCEDDVVWKTVVLCPTPPTPTPTCTPTKTPTPTLPVYFCDTPIHNIDITPTPTPTLKAVTPERDCEHTMYIGFGASTGVQNNAHIIKNFEFTNKYQSIDYITFLNDATLKNSAVKINSELRLTDAIFDQTGQAVYQFPVFYKDASNILINWNASFEFQIANGTGADGLTFFLTTTPPSAIPANLGLGDGKGYAGIPNSIGVSFDTWDNSISLPKDFAVINFDGIMLDSIKSAEQTPEFIGGSRYVWLQFLYDTLTVYYSNSSNKPEEPILTTVLNTSQYMRCNSTAIQPTPTPTVTPSVTPAPQQCADISLPLNSVIVVDYFPSIDKYSVTTANDGVIHDVRMVTRNIDPVTHYAHHNINAEFNAIGASFIYFYRDPGNSQNYLVLKHSKVNTDPSSESGSMCIEYIPSLPLGSTWIVSDDSAAEVDTYGDLTYSSWSWVKELTDGGVISLPDSNHTFSLSSNMIKGINSWTWLNGCVH